MARRLCLVAGLLLAGCQTYSAPAEDGVMQDSRFKQCDGSDKSNYLPVVNGYLNTPPRLGDWNQADCKVLAPIWTGNDDKGQLFLPLRCV